MRRRLDLTVSKEKLPGWPLHLEDRNGAFVDIRYELPRYEAKTGSRASTLISYFGNLLLYRDRLPQDPREQEAFEKVFSSVRDYLELADTIECEQVDTEKKENIQTQPCQ